MWRDGRKKTPLGHGPAAGNALPSEVPSTTKVPRVIRFRFMGLPEREIMGLVTIFPTEHERSRVLVTVEGNHLFPKGKYSVEVSGDGLLLPVAFDADRGLWYCDIEIDTEAAYGPFVRLALVRYQPHSIPDAHLSRAQILIVQGRLDQARGDCAALALGLDGSKRVGDREDPLVLDIHIEDGAIDHIADDRGERRGDGGRRSIEVRPTGRTCPEDDLRAQ